MATGRPYTISQGDKVWIPDPVDCFKVHTVKEKRGETVTVFDEDYKIVEVPASDVYPCNPPHMNGVADNTELMYLQDPSLLENIRQRYVRDEIYTYTAYILTAVNPYKQLNIYSDEMIKKYYGQPVGRLPPHVFAIADRAFRNMRSSKKNQSIVVSGESGAGKTETCKFVMRFMASVGGAGPVGTIDVLERKILEANPILEAFGNAKTLRNNNSSRFGKFTELLFSTENHVSGATIETYLLEKSRLVGQTKGERNFHIFYQLLAGASAAEKTSYKLQGVDVFHYTNQSGATDIDGVDDAKSFAELKNSMKLLNFKDDDQAGVFRTLSGLLHFGNVKFITIEETDTTEVDPETASFLATAAELMNIEKDVLVQRVVTRTMKAGGREESFVIPLKADEAVGARDALSKFIYDHLFSWVVSRINADIPCADKSRFMGILDISGFEIFEVNSFEQLCINFANEKIQRYFNIQILQQEQQIYELEGLRWRKVEYKDNQAIIDLFEEKATGILVLLDEECVMPKATDQTFSVKVHTTHTNNQYISKPTYAKKKKRLTEMEAFVIQHFAGEVTYETKNFLVKNNDTLHDDLIQLLIANKATYTYKLFPDLLVEDEEVVYGKGQGRFKSVGGKFRKQLTHLMDTLQSTTSHFIRCIKPNTDQKPNKFDGNSVMQQLRYSGMCTALILMEAGFPTRIAFDELHARYSPRLPAVIAKLKPIIFCEALLVALDLHGGKDFQMGLTKVFFRAGKLAVMDELTSDSKEAMQNVVGKVKKWLAKKRFFGAAWAVASINRLGRTIRLIRGCRRFRRAVRITVWIQRVWLSTLQSVRKRIYSEEVLRKRREEEERRIAEQKRIEEERKAEEERIRKEEEEARRQKEEEIRRKAEEERRRQEEERQQMQSKISQLTESHSKMEQFKELSDLLKEQLKQEQNRASDLTEKLSQESEKREIAEIKIESLQNNLTKTEDKLANEQKTVVELESSLRLEKESHADTKVEYNRQLEEQHKESASHLSAKQAVIEKLTHDRNQLEAQHAELKATSSKRIEDLETSLSKALAEIESLKSNVKDLEGKLGKANEHIDKLERERQNLIQIAIKCQEAQIHLKNVYNHFKNESDLAKILFNDISFVSVMKGNQQNSRLIKQGGKDTKKWAPRHFVLNENFLFYFANSGDKNPKGIVRLDLARAVEKIDLSSLDKKFCFKIVMRAGREYFMSCSSESELNDWITALEKQLP